MPKKALPVVKPAKVSQPVTSSQPKRTTAPALSKSKTTVQVPPKSTAETFGTPEKKEGNHHNKLKSLKKVNKLISDEKKGARIAQMVK